MAVNLSPIGGVAAQFFDNSGNVLSGGKIYTYAAGTTTPQATYTSAGGTTAHSNPIILDAAGRVPSGEIWLTDGSQYKFLIKTSADVQIGSYDNIVGINSNFVNYTNSQEFQTATAGQTVFTLTTMAYQPGTNSLSVFVDGVNQYGPGALYAYQETSDTVVTFTSGLHVGADVKFTTSAINASSYGDAQQISYTPSVSWAPPTNAKVQFDTIGNINDSAWGVVKQNTSDYASLGANLLPAFASLTKSNFDISGNHTAGTVGTILAPVTGNPFSYYFLKMVVSTTTIGNIGITQSGTSIFGDISGYYFSTATILNDAGENNQYVTDDDYYFYVQTSATGFTDITITTDTSWAGQISSLELFEVDATKFAIGGCGSDANGYKNPVGLKVGALNRNDMAIGNVYTLGLMSYDGVSPIAAQNVAMGSYALATNWKGDENTALGTLALAYNEGSNNVGIGYSALKFNTKGQENTAIGYKAGSLNTTGYRNTFVGMWSGTYNRTGINNTRVGWSPIIVGGLSSSDTSVGAPAGTAVLSGGSNSFFGSASGVTVSGQAELNLTGSSAFGYASKPWGNYSVAVGFNATVGAEGAFADNAISIGYGSAAPNTDTVAIGAQSNASGLRSVVIGKSTTAAERGISLGYEAKSNAFQTTSIGYQAGTGFTGNSNTFLGSLAGVQTVAYTNCTLLGNGTAVTGSNQVQLGDSATTTYAYGAVQNRSDARDKTDIRDTQLGLDFINALRPVDFRWDYRADYDGEKDGSKARSRFHHGLIAQEVKSACDAAGVDFGGYQDHTISGGADVLSIGYDEMIAPLIKAVQELTARVAELEAKQ